MNSTKQHAFPGYDDICEQLDYAAYRNMKFSAAYCQSLLETAESYAQEAQSVQSLKATVMELIAHLNALPYSKRFSAEREARLSLIERAEKVLHAQNDTGATGGTDAI